MCPSGDVPVSYHHPLLAYNRRHGTPSYEWERRLQGMWMCRARKQSASSRGVRVSASLMWVESLR